MGKVKQGDTVKVDYVGRLSDGKVFDSSEGREPLELTVGEKRVIPGFEEAVVGMEVGESRRAEVPAAEAYGEPDPGLRFDVPRERFPESIDPHVGQRLELSQPDGPSWQVTVREVQGDVVTLDANHPLAGENLIFDITVRGIS